MISGKEYAVDELGVLSPTQVQVDQLHAGEVGYLAASIRAVEDARVGDTITLAAAPANNRCLVTSRQTDGLLRDVSH
jgi:GTP-binding protein LepA